MEAFAIGLDFGTLSGRAVLVRVRDGLVLAEASREYAHGVLSDHLPDGTPLPPDWALQHPQDYLQVLEQTVREVMRKAGLQPEAVIGIGLDFTGSTVIALDDHGAPLCFAKAYESRPHAWVKLWKHHGAWREAADFTRAAREHDPDLLLRNGGRISPECLFPKALQMLREDPALYEKASQFMEAGDWVVAQMTGAPVRSAACAAFKAFWREGIGYPGDAFLMAVDPGLKGFPAQKLSGRLVGLGKRAGELTAEMAARLGLAAGTAVAAAQFDAYAALPALGITGPEAAMLSIGTSLAVILVGEDVRSRVASPCGEPLCAPVSGWLREVEGVCSIAEGGSLPGYVSYGSGQYSAGDLLGWYAKNSVPAEYAAEACARSMDVHALLSEKAGKMAPGECGLLALDWWNGNRSCLVDAELSGLLVGMTLATRPEAIYRALMEGIAFGTRRIFDSYAKAGMPIRKVCACGGVAQKNAVMMQIYADVLGMPLGISRSPQAPAIGAAMFAATAAGSGRGGWGTVFEAAAHMRLQEDMAYQPQKAHVALYDRLYQEYITLHDYFGRGGNDVMKRLRQMAAARPEA